MLGTAKQAHLTCSASPAEISEGEKGLECQTGEQGNAPVDPMPLRHGRWQVNEQHKIGRVTCCGQGACPCQGFVHWAAVEGVLGRLAMLHGLHPDDGHLSEQLLGL